jgi:hypothetical protein
MVKDTRRRTNNTQIKKIGASDFTAGRQTVLENYYSKILQIIVHGVRL